MVSRPAARLRRSPPDFAAARALDAPEGWVYHDGRFKTLADVVEHYDSFFGLALTAEEKQELIEYLKSL
jgi:hypothetical protein